MAEWLTVEVLDGAGEPASSWRRAHEDGLVEAAVTQGARYREWHDTRWGVVPEVAFDDDRLERFRALPAVRAALDAVPDPLAGLLIHRGRGGEAGARVPRRPRPRPVAGAAALPPPEPEPVLRLGGEPPALDEDPDDVEPVRG